MMKVKRYRWMACLLICAMVFGMWSGNVVKGENKKLTETGAPTTTAPAATAPPQKTTVPVVAGDEVIEGVRFKTYPLEAGSDYVITTEKEKTEIPVTELGNLLSKVTGIVNTYQRWMKVVSYTKTIDNVTYKIETLDEDKMGEKKVTVSGSNNSRLNGVFNVTLTAQERDVYQAVIKKEGDSSEPVNLTITDGSDNVVVTGDYNGAEYRVEVAKGNSQVDLFKGATIDSMVRIARITKDVADYEMCLQKAEVESRKIKVEKLTTIPSSTPTGTPTILPTETPTVVPTASPIETPSTPTETPQTELPETPSIELPLITPVPATPPTYTLTLNPNKGTLSQQTIRFTAEEIGKVSLPTPSRKGYKFIGWYNGKNRVEKITVAKDLTLKAQWVQASIDLKYQSTLKWSKYLSPDVKLTKSVIEKKYTKYVKINQKKGTMEGKKYFKKAKVTLRINGKSIDVTVKRLSPKPKVKIVKAGKRIPYAIGVYRTFKLSYKHEPGATRAVAEYSYKKKSGFKKCVKELNTLKGGSVSVKKGRTAYFRVTVYYGKYKSSKSELVVLKG